MFFSLLKHFLKNRDLNISIVVHPHKGLAFIATKEAPNVVNEFPLNDTGNVRKSLSI